MSSPTDSSDESQAGLTVDQLSSTGDLKFTDFSLKPQLLANLQEMGWLQPSPIQQETLPLTLAGLNVVGRAKSGTGKTGAFLIPLLQRLNPRRKCVQALILVPRHELAMQTSRVCIRMAAQMRIKTLCTTEETNLRDDILRCLQKVHVVVGTPKRVLDLMRCKVADLQHLRLVVLDETDALLAADVRVMTEKILWLLPPRQVQHLLFSTIFSKAVKSLVDKFVGNPRAVNLIDDVSDPLLQNVTQFYVHVEEPDKLMAFREVYRKLRVHQMVILCRPEAQRCETLAKLMTVMGVRCYYWHPEMLVQHRNRVMHEFREGVCRHLVCTDALVRGLDVPAVNVVVNFDMALRMDTYMQRMGRAGRYGRLGLVINFVTGPELHKIALLEKSLNTAIYPFPSCLHQMYRSVLVEPLNRYISLMRFVMDDIQLEEIGGEISSGNPESVEMNIVEEAERLMRSKEDGLMEFLMQEVMKRVKDRKKIMADPKMEPEKPPEEEEEELKTLDVEEPIIETVKESKSPIHPKDSKESLNEETKKLPAKKVSKESKKEKKQKDSEPKVAPENPKKQEEKSKKNKKKRQQKKRKHAQSEPENTPRQTPKTQLQQTNVGIRANRFTGIIQFRPDTETGWSIFQHHWPAEQHPFQVVPEPNYLQSLAGRLAAVGVQEDQLTNLKTAFPDHDMCSQNCAIN